ncbi:Bur2p SCDLUD_001901 [Saccharomycodes ludwigii]|uniref:Bur2p n=1 Tax=Saccharomycodes ludwigii TaxID=36035 RepID=UPI001E886EA1|nr:hypothetical protein SCDLUD_001901 [Saccharomycodes ludwigii]KAH3902088.1 hypothetical protein SCDLUD_001901 [Saccharomycodes ludwigii]
MSSVPTTNKIGFISRTLWPDIIQTPQNKWIYTCAEIIGHLNKSPNSSNIKKKMERCLAYFYQMKKILSLMDHTYTAACILFFRYWILYELPPTIPECIYLSQTILVTACKISENNRPIQAYVKATSEYFNGGSNNNVASDYKKKQQQIEKMKWEIRDRLVANEKLFLCKIGFDICIENPKFLLEQIFNDFYRYTRDADDFDDYFKHVFPRILQECRAFIVQAETHPVSLLCDGYQFVQLGLIWCGVQYKKRHEEFKFPKNFFQKRFPKRIDVVQMSDLFHNYLKLENAFLSLRSNKGGLLSVSSEEIKRIIDETEEESGDSNNEDEISDVNFNLDFYYNQVKNGEENEAYLSYMEDRILHLYEDSNTSGDSLSSSLSSSGSKKRYSENKEASTAKRSKA